MICHAEIMSAPERLCNPARRSYRHSHSFPLRDLRDLLYKFLLLAHASRSSFAANCGSVFLSRICSVKFQNFFPTTGLLIPHPNRLAAHDITEVWERCRLGFTKLFIKVRKK